MTPSSEDEEDSFNRFSARDSGPKFDDDEPEFPRYKPAEAPEAIEAVVITDRTGELGQMSDYSLPMLVAAHGSKNTGDPLELYTRAVSECCKTKRAN